jgi:pilus assembly protein Flp/PilA
VSTAMIIELKQRIAAALRTESGQGLVEYALILLFISVVAIAVIVFLGPGISNAISNIANNL